MDLEKFKKDFGGVSTRKMIDYAIDNKTFTKEDIINSGVKYKLENNITIKLCKIKRSFKYLVRIGFISIDGDKYKFNKDFVPRNQE